MAEKDKLPTLDELMKLARQSKEDIDGSMGRIDGIMEHLKTNEEVTLSQKEQVTTLAKQVEDALTAMNRTDIPSGLSQKEEQYGLQTKEFGNWMMRGKEYDDTKYSELGPFEQKMLSSDNLRTGGHWMPTTMYNRILEVVRRIDPFRQIANVVQLQDGDTLEGLYESGTLDAGWTAERATVTEKDTPEIDKWQIPTHPMYVFPKITQKMARLGAFDVENWLLGKYANAFSYLEGLAFINGTGSGQPNGLMTRAVADAGAAGKVTITHSGAAATIPDFDCLKSMKAALGEQYQPGASWIMNRATFLILDQLTDAVGHYMLQDTVTGGNNAYDTPGEAMLLGKPVHFMYTMATATTDTYPLAYGDFKQAYTVVDAPGAFVVRDEQTDFGRIVFKTERLGVGGDVIDYDAFNILKCAV
jgi:HK97 family phage major capsid protein